MESKAQFPWPWQRRTMIFSGRLSHSDYLNDYTSAALSSASNSCRCYLRVTLLYKETRRSVAMLIGARKRGREKNRKRGREKRNESSNGESLFHFSLLQQRCIDVKTMQKTRNICGNYASGTFSAPSTRQRLCDFARCDSLLFCPEKYSRDF